jgi:hypothetical protein
MLIRILRPRPSWRSPWQWSGATTAPPRPPLPPTIVYDDNNNYDDNTYDDNNDDIYLTAQPSAAPTTAQPTPYPYAQPTSYPSAQPSPYPQPTGGDSNYGDTTPPTVHRRRGA